VIHAEKGWLVLQVCRSTNAACSGDATPFALEDDARCGSTYLRDGTGSERGIGRAERAKSRPPGAQPKKAFSRSR
jgi:hypothetical protein